MKYTVAGRGSKLSIAQTNQVIRDLQASSPQDTFDTIRITTKGDKDARDLFRMESRGIFEKEVDAAVLEGSADFAVHSMKDVPTQISPELTIACVPRRFPPNDILVCREGMGMPPRSGTIGTSSLRRAAQIMREFPGVTVQPLRGNVDTRLSKVGSEIDGVVLAHAGIKRLALDTAYTILPAEKFVPSPGQGALAVITRKDDHRTISLLQSIQDQDSRTCVEAERAVSRIIDSGCRFPVGIYAYMSNDMIHIIAAAYPPGNGRSIIVRVEGKDPIPTGTLAGTVLLDRGVEKFGLKWRQAIKQQI